MSILHICCNLAGSTVFPQLFEALEAEGVEQVVFVPEKRKADLNKNVPSRVETYSALTVKTTDALLFFRKAQRTVPAIEKRVDMQRVQLIHAHTLFTDGSIAHKLHQKYQIPYIVTLRYSDIEAIWRYEPHLHPMARRILMDAKFVVFLGGAAKAKVFGEWLNMHEQPLIEEKSVIIPNGIRPEWRDGEARQGLHTPVRVGFAGVLTRRKRPL
ncbi:MAG: glycosyltransferase, partial [Clostridia bacterium]|nr:glycosyltransferase [Clostridia bacterium]